MKMWTVFVLFLMTMGCGVVQAAGVDAAGIVDMKVDWSLGWLADSNAWATLLLLIALELVLGIDNILVITLAVSRIESGLRDKARRLGLALALVMRLAALCGASLLMSMRDPVFHIHELGLSVKDLVLLSGGLFLTWKAVSEIHHCVEKPAGHDSEGMAKAAATTFGAAIVQIVILDAVFSIDSIITAVGLTSFMWVIILAVLLSFVAVLAFAKPIGDFVLRHTALKILALSFLVCIGMTLIMEGIHKHVEKEYLYLPMGFALLVELLQMRASHNAGRHSKNSIPVD